MTLRYIARTLYETRALLLQAIAKFTERGMTIDHLEASADHLEQASHHFVLQTIPWYRRPMENVAHALRQLPDYIPFYYCCVRVRAED